MILSCLWLSADNTTKLSGLSFHGTSVLQSTSQTELMEEK